MLGGLTVMWAYDADSDVEAGQVCLTSVVRLRGAEDSDVHGQSAAWGQVWRSSFGRLSYCEDGYLESVSLSFRATLL